MTMPVDQHRYRKGTVTPAEAGNVEPAVHAGMSADIHLNATVLTLVGNTSYRKIDVREVWS